MEFIQMTLFEFDLKYDCSRCFWMKEYRYCYPDITLRRRRFIRDPDGVSCTDYCTKPARIRQDAVRKQKR